MPAHQMHQHLALMCLMSIHERKVWAWTAHLIDNGEISSIESAGTYCNWLYADRVDRRIGHHCLLVSLVAPRYYRTVDNAREASLKTSLNVMRDAIDKFAADKGQYPDSLSDLVAKGYLRKIPEDPVTGTADSWQMLPPPAGSQMTGSMADVRSGATGKAQDGQPYGAW